MFKLVKLHVLSLILLFPCYNCQINTDSPETSLKTSISLGWSFKSPRIALGKFFGFETIYTRKIKDPENFCSYRLHLLIFMTLEIKSEKSFKYLLIHLNIIKPLQQEHINYLSKGQITVFQNKKFRWGASFYIFINLFNVWLKEKSARFS